MKSAIEQSPFLLISINDKPEGCFAQGSLLLKAEGDLTTVIAEINIPHCLISFCQTEQPEDSKSNFLAGVV